LFIAEGHVDIDPLKSACYEKCGLKCKYHAKRICILTIKSISGPASSHAQAAVIRHAFKR